jgi:Rrf2 family protein
MKLSTKCRYGLRAMLEIARHYNKGPVNRNIIVEAQHISKAYLENILTSLREKKLIRTERGANGGFILQSDPSKITVLQIVNALEGSIAPVDCLEHPDKCGKSRKCVAQKVWQKMYDAQVEVLSGITLQNMLEMESSPDAGMYSI